MVFHIQYPFLQPLLEAFSRARLLVILEIKIIISASVSLGRRRVGAEGLVDDAGNHESGNHVPIRVTQNHVVIDDLFTSKNDPFRGEARFAHDAEIAPRARVALAVGALHVQAGEIRIYGATGQQLVAGERPANRGTLIFASTIAARNGSPRYERKARSR